MLEIGNDLWPQHRWSPLPVHGIRQMLWRRQFLCAGISEDFLLSVHFNLWCFGLGLTCEYMRRQFHVLRLDSEARSETRPNLWTGGNTIRPQTYWSKHFAGNDVCCCGGRDRSYKCIRSRDSQGPQVGKLSCISRGLFVTGPCTDDCLSAPFSLVHLLTV